MSYTSVNVKLNCNVFKCVKLFIILSLSQLKVIRQSEPFHNRYPIFNMFLLQVLYAIVLCMIVLETTIWACFVLGEGVGLVVCVVVLVCFFEFFGVIVPYEVFDFVPYLCKIV